MTGPAACGSLDVEVTTGENRRANLFGQGRLTLFVPAYVGYYIWASPLFAGDLTSGIDPTYPQIGTVGTHFIELNRLPGVNTPDYRPETITYALYFDPDNLGRENAKRAELVLHVTPEPTTWALLGSGLAIVGSAATRRRRARRV